jgi:hypothetical protein
MATSLLGINNPAIQVAIVTWRLTPKECWVLHPGTQVQSYKAARKSGM